MLEVATAIRKVARVLWSMHTLFNEVCRPTTPSPTRPRNPLRPLNAHHSVFSKLGSCICNQYSCDHIFWAVPVCGLGTQDDT